MTRTEQDVREEIGAGLHPNAPRPPEPVWSGTYWSFPSAKAVATYRRAMDVYVYSEVARRRGRR